MTGTRRSRTPILLALAALAAVLPEAARAHGGEGLTDATALTTWRFTLEVVLATALIGAVYGRGVRRRRLVREGPGRWRHVALLSGVAVVFLALQSPIDPMAGRLFWMHQVQHLMLRMLGPMPIALAAPQGLLAAGLPRGVRRSVLVPVVSNGGVRGALRFVRDPGVAFALFLASLYFWQIPPVHNAAVLDPVIHYVMHVTMLGAGLLFWLLIFDPRDPPKGLRHGVRLVMLVGTILSNIVLGALTTLKERVLYSAYDLEGRLFDIAPLTDEVTGGYTIWVPASMMCVIAIIIAMNRWAGHEEKQDAQRLEWSSSNSRTLEFPETAEELRLKVRASNRALALSMSLLSLSILLTVFTVVIAIHTLA